MAVKHVAKAKIGEWSSLSGRRVPMELRLLLAVQENNSLYLLVAELLYNQTLWLYVFLTKTLRLHDILSTCDIGLKIILVPKVLFAFFFLVGFQCPNFLTNTFNLQKVNNWVSAVCLPACMPVHPSIHPSARLSVRPSA